jgi:threonine/homoserine/homoserine lactone efflux protein
MIAQFILPAIGLGLSAAALPGPMQAYILNLTLRFGWRKGILVLMGPLITDAPIILLTTFLLGQLPEWAIALVRVAGGLLLLWLAWGAWRAFRAGATIGGDGAQWEEAPSDRRVLGTSVMMNFLSPGPYLFWSTVNGPLLLAALEVSVWWALAFLVAFYGTFLGMLALLVLLFDRLGSLDERVTRAIILVSIALLLIFGTGLIADAFGLAALHRALAALALGAAALAGLVRWLGRAHPAPD